MLTVREDNAARTALDAAMEKSTRTLDAWDAITWVIARDPKAGDPVTESGLVRAYTLDGARSIDLPTVTLLYGISAFYIIVHDAKFEDAKYGQAGRSKEITSRSLHRNRSTTRMRRG